MKHTRCNRLDERTHVGWARAIHSATRRHRMAPFLVSTALAALLAACSPLQPPRAEEPVLHVLDVRPVVARAIASRDLVLEVGTPRAAPGFDSAALVYVQKPFVLDAFATHRWADTPARMIEAPLMRTLEQTGLFRAVVPAPAGVPADVRLDTDLLRLQHNFATRPSRVELSLRFRLSDLRGRRVIAVRVVDIEMVAASNDPAGGVAAANAALADALAQAAAFTVTAVADVRQPAKGTP